MPPSSQPPAPQPALLNSWISRAPSTQALLALHTEHGSQMDGMHLGNLWNKIGRHAKFQPAGAAALANALGAPPDLRADEDWAKYWVPRPTSTLKV